MSEAIPYKLRAGAKMQDARREQIDPVGDAMAVFRARVQSLEAELDALMVEREQLSRAGARQEALEHVSSRIEAVRRRILGASGDRRADPVPRPLSWGSSGTIVVK